MKAREPSQPETNLLKENTRLKQLIVALKVELAKLQKKNAKLEVQNISARLRIEALEKLKVPQEPEPLSDLELARRIAFLLNRGGLDLHGNPLVKGKA